MAKKATKKKLHNLPDEVTVWRDGKQELDNGLLCDDFKVDENTGFSSGTIFGVYKLVSVGVVTTKTIIDLIEEA